MLCVMDLIHWPCGARTKIYIVWEEWQTTRFTAMCACVLKYTKRFQFIFGSKMFVAFHHFRKNNRCDWIFGWFLAILLLLLMIAWEIFTFVKCLNEWKNGLMCIAQQLRVLFLFTSFADFLSLFLIFWLRSSSFEYTLPPYHRFF